MYSAQNKIDAKGRMDAPSRNGYSHGLDCTPFPVSMFFFHMSASEDTRGKIQPCKFVVSQGWDRIIISPARLVSFDLRRQNPLFEPIRYESVS